MAAAAAVRPCFSAAVTPSIQPRHPPSDGVVRFPGLRALRAPNVAYSVDLLSISGGATPQRWWLPRVPAAVAQEEAAAAVEEAEALEEEKEGSEAQAVEGAGGGAVAAEAPVNIKLYFGNLPYNCDSAQLAGIIQDYATPEMVEDLEISRSFRPAVP